MAMRLRAQIRWRIVGGVSVGLCALMTFLGSGDEGLRESLVVFFVYWAIVFVLFLVAILCVLIDLRFIRAQYAVNRRDLFRETLGSSEFRETLREAQRKHRNQNRLN